MSSRRNRPSSHGRNRSSAPAQNTGRRDARPHEDRDPDRDDDRRSTASSRGAPRNNNRSGNRQRRPPFRRDDQPAVTKEASAPSNGLRFEVSSFQSLTPLTDYSLVNITAEGYLTIIRNCYSKMLRLDPRIQRRLPEDVFIHNMNQLFHVQMMRISFQTRQQNPWGEVIPQDSALHAVTGDKVIVPIEIWTWLQGIGRWTTKDGVKFLTNTPKGTLPGKRRVLNGHQLNGGDFGVPTGANHNAYEIAIAPITTRLRIEALLANQPVNGVIEYDPLPPTLMPPRLEPTENLLGYQPNLPPWHGETRAMYLPALGQWDDLPLGSRLCYNPKLWALQESAMGDLTSKMSCKIGLPDLDTGSLAIYGQIVTLDGNAHTVLQYDDGHIESHSELDPCLTATTAVYTYRRRRTREAPGTCFLNADGTVPAGWLATINNSHNMLVPFAPSFGEVNEKLNMIAFNGRFNAGRQASIYSELVRLTLLK